MYEQFPLCGSSENCCKKRIELLICTTLSRWCLYLDMADIALTFHGITENKGKVDNLGSGDLQKFQLSSFFL